MNHRTWQKTVWIVALSASTAASMTLSVSADVVGDAVKDVAALRSQRTQAEDRVSAIKSSFKPGDGQYTTAKKLYTDAYEAFDGFETAVVLQIRTGVKLDADSSAALKANEKFCAYADEQLQRKVDSVAWGTVLKIVVAGLGGIQEMTQGSNGVKQDSKAGQADKTSQVDKGAIADAVEKEIKWKRWDAVTAQ